MRATAAIGDGEFTRSAAIGVWLLAIQTQLASASLPHSENTIPRHPVVVAEQLWGPTQYTLPTIEGNHPEQLQDVSSNSTFNAINEAKERGRKLQQQVLASDEFVTKEELEALCREFETTPPSPTILNAFEFWCGELPPNGKAVYPRWLSDKSVQRITSAASEQLLRIDKWARWQFFNSGHPALDGRTPLEIAMLKSIDGSPSRSSHFLDADLAVVEAARDFVGEITL